MKENLNLLQLILIIEVADEYTDVSVSYILNELQEDFDNLKDDLEYAKKHINEILSSKERLNEYVGECKFSGLYYR
tara:strand:- start:739 stop:966 length:228 start_codon:yes stop_codon:yes gene_type:complete